MYEEGYDSDGELPNFGNMEYEKHLMEKYNEVVLPSHLPPYDTTAPPTVATGASLGLQSTSVEAASGVDSTNGGGNFVLIPDGELMKMKVAELRKERKARDLSTSGKKEELQQRRKKASTL